MAKRKVGKIFRQSGDFHGWIVWCPGCGGVHVYDQRWRFNGDRDSPTLKPSYLATSTRGSKPHRCHSFLTNGRLQFLDDCSHELAGQTVEIEAKFDDEDE